MHSATSLQGSGVVRNIGQCVQTRVAIETYPQMRVTKHHTFKRPAKQATEP